MKFILAPVKLTRTVIIFLEFLLLAVGIVHPASALPNHPGGYLREAELELIRSNVTANIQPQASAFAAMINSGPNASWTTGESGNVVNSYDMQNQGNYIWTLTVKWIGSGNTNYAVAAWKGIDQWVNNVTNMTATTTLRTGVGGCQMANAAEILAYGFGGSSGWPAANIAKAKAWFKSVPYKAISGGVSSRTGNWGTSALTGCMAMAVFCDDQTMFDYAVNAYKFGFQDTTDGNCGVSQYIDATGEAMESGRDQGHVQGGLAHLAEVALMAWNQGVNIVPYNDTTGTSGVNGSYGVSGTNRLFIGIDSYEAKYNLGGTVSYHPYLTPWGQIYYPNGIAPRGSWSSPVWEMITHLFAMARMIPTYSGQIPLLPGYAPETSNGDHVGYGTLLFHNITAVPVAYIGEKYNGTNIGSPNALGSSTTKDMAFDSSLATFYSSTNASGDWTGLDFGVGVSNWIGRIRYCPRDNFAASMTGGIFQGANDSAFASPVTLYTITNAPPTNQMTLQIISLSLTNKFRYVRYLGPANANCNVAELEFYPPLYAVPPAGLTAVAANQQITLTWGTNTTANTYVLKRGLASGGPYTNLLSITATNYTDTGLTSGVPYYYVVSSTNSYGESTNSTEASAIPAGKVNGTVIGTASSYNNSGNTIANVFDGDLNTYFDAPSGSIGPWAGLDFGSDVSNTITQIKYCPRINFPQRMTGGIFQGATDPNFTNPVTLFTITVQPPQSVMTVQPISVANPFRYVRYLGPTNASCNVSEVEFDGYTGIAPVVPASPPGLTATAYSTQVVLSWNTVANAESYNVKRSLASGGPYTSIATDVATPSYADSGLIDGVNYYYVVSAVNVFGESPDSAQASAMSGQITLVNPGFETNTSGMVLSNVKLATGYDISTNDVAGWLNAGATQTDSGVDYAGHNGIVVHGGSVTAYCRGGDSGAYQISGYQMQSGDQIQLKWYAKSSYGTATENVKLLSAANPTDAYASLLSLTNISVSMSGGGNGAAYTQYTLNYPVTEADAGRYVAVSFAATSANNTYAMFDDFSLLAGSLPAAPTGLTATAGDGQVIVSWNPSADTAGYRLKQSTVNSGSYSVIASNVTDATFTNTGLANGTMYYYVISATNAFGESANSVQVSARPVSGAAASLGVALIGSQLQFSWPSDHTGWLLQAQSNSVGVGLGTNWVTVTGTDATNQMSVPLDVGNSSVFFRLISL